MQPSERSLLIQTQEVNFKPGKSNGLSLIFAIICIVDVFGVFPVIALPKAIIDCGYYGILLVIFVCSVQIYTAVLLGKCWIIAQEIEPAIDKKSRYPYSALSELTYGKSLAKLVTLLVDFTVFFGGIPNLIVASQNLQLLGLRLTDENLNISFCYWIVVLGVVLCPILWLGSPKDMKFLCTISVFIVLTVFLLVNGSLLSASKINPLPDDTYRKSAWEYALVAFGIITFQFDIHPAILTIHVDMKNKKEIPKAIIWSFLISVGMFTMTCTNAYLKYEHHLKPSILESLPTTIPLHLASVLVSIQLCITSAISNSALYQHMEESLNISREFSQKRCILRTALIIAAILIAESVPRFDIVMSLIGATLTSPLVFMVPPLIYLRILNLQDKHRRDLAMESFTSSAYNDEENVRKLSESELEVSGQTDLIEFLKKGGGHYCTDRVLELIICFTIIFLSFLCTLTATYLNLKDAINYENYSLPCIYNISMYLLKS